MGTEPIWRGGSPCGAVRQGVRLTCVIRWNSATVLQEGSRRKRAFFDIFFCYQFVKSIKGKGEFGFMAEFCFKIRGLLEKGFIVKCGFIGIFVLFPEVMWL